MLTPKTIAFFKELKKNNNRDWFNAHKADYLLVKDEFESLVEDVIGRIGKFDKDIADLSTRDCIFRIYKDVRFAKDKSPYKTNMGAWMVKDGKKAKRAPVTTFMSNLTAVSWQAAHICRIRIG